MLLKEKKQKEEEEEKKWNANKINNTVFCLRS